MLTSSGLNPVPVPHTPLSVSRMSMKPTDANSNSLVSTSASFKSESATAKQRPLRASGSAVLVCGRLELNWNANSFDLEPSRRWNTTKETLQPTFCTRRLKHPSQLFKLCAASVFVDRTEYSRSTLSTPTLPQFIRHRTRAKDLLPFTMLWLLPAVNQPIRTKARKSSWNLIACPSLRGNLVRGWVLVGYALFNILFFLVLCKCRAWLSSWWWMGGNHRYHAP